MIKFIGADDAEEMDRLVSKFSVDNIIIDLDLSMAANDFGFYLVAVIQYRPIRKRGKSAPRWVQLTDHAGPSA
jgi:hypothetical protein